MAIYVSKDKMELVIEGNKDTNYDLNCYDKHESIEELNTLKKGESDGDSQGSKECRSENRSTGKG